MFDKTITGSFQSQLDKTTLFYVAYKQKKFDPKKCIVVHHGFGEHSGRYGNLVGLFEKSPYSVFLMDMRGHGRSDGVRGGAPGFDAYLEDLHSFFVFLKRSFKVTKPLLVAHSLGGLIAIAYCLDKKYAADVKALAVNGSLLHFHFTPLIYIKRIVGSIITAVAPNFRMKVGLKKEQISHDAAVVAAYAGDPLVHGHIGIKVANQTLDKAAWCLKNAPLMKMPILITHGAADEISNPDGSTGFYEKCGSKDRTLIVYDNLYHEIFNELGKEKSLGDVKKWIQKHL